MGLSEIQHRGRWDCLKTLGHYVQSANAAMAFARLGRQAVAAAQAMGAHFDVVVRGA